jgi:2-keto-4-pentenoate hydratase/2-oxohepta-3-ene-1,7-dioic acid hydratase in catechol pathway
MAMKSDSSLLNQGKPFFLPDLSKDIRQCPCVVVRICRLGRSIEPRFADRYYDALAYGIDFRANDLLQQGQITEGLVFDGALCVGEWLPTATFRQQSDMLPVIEQALPIEDAIAQISRVMTLRMGDLLYIDLPEEAQPVQREDIISRYHNEQPLLYCRIK